MSPNRSKAEADARSDIFAAGAILYEMLTVPAAGRRQSNLGSSTRNSRELSLILRCLEPEKDKRNATAREIRPSSKR
jgi:hypothetical protein